MHTCSSRAGTLTNFITFQTYVLGYIVSACTPVENRLILIQPLASSQGILILLAAIDVKTLDAVEKERFPVVR